SPSNPDKIAFFLWILALAFGFITSIGIIRLTKEFRVIIRNIGLLYGTIGILFYLLSLFLLLCFAGPGRA
ncbi:MAG: hypothetical protein AMJ78_10565, partial [Omnitrophica WOR_2 bacterium SM23_29]